MNMIGEILLYKELPKEGGKVGDPIGSGETMEKLKAESG